MTITEIKAQLALLQEELRVVLNPHAMTLTEEKLFSQAKLNFGKHLTLNNAIPAEVGCAECVSKLLSLVGISDGPLGIPGTASLYEWLVTSPKFQKIDHPEQGAIIISPTGMGNGSIPGHTGIIGEFGGKYLIDWTIYSNESASGLLKDQWSYERWLSYYQTTGELPIYLFRLV